MDNPKLSLILASQSTTRQRLLKNAGLTFTTKSVPIDERIIERDHPDLSPKELATTLAEHKALSIKTNASSAVIGSDQVLSLNNTILHKAKTLVELETKLKTLSGQTHTLISAVALNTNNSISFSTYALAHMTMYDLSHHEISSYITHFGEKVLSSVGGYHFEAEGVRLFKEVQGDYHAILGFPLLPLLNELKTKYAL